MAALAGAAAVFGASAANAHATTTTIGPADLNPVNVDTEDPLAFPATSVHVVQDEEVVQITSPGTLTSWGVNFLPCSDDEGETWHACGQARLLVLRQTDPFNFAVVARSAGETATRIGVNTFTSNIAVEPGDMIGLELTQGTVPYVDDADDTDQTNAGAMGGLPTIGMPFLTGGRQALYNATLTSTVPTTTTLSTTAPMNTVNGGDSVRYKAVVTPAPAGGTVSLTLDGEPLPTCQNLELTEGRAYCDAPTEDVAGVHGVTAHYSGDDTSLPSLGGTQLLVKGHTTTTTIASSSTVAPGAAVTFTAAVSPPPDGGWAEEASISPDRGTVAFSLDGEAIQGCDAKVPDVDSGTAKCETTAPQATGHHTVTATYSGGDIYIGSHGDVDLTVSSGDDSSPEPPAPTPTPTPEPPTATPTPAPVSTPTPTPAPTGATLAPKAKTTLTTTTTSTSTQVSVPVQCPSGVACTLDGTVVVSLADVSRAAVHAASVQTQTVARFSGVRVDAGKVRAIKLHLSPSFVKTAQRKGVHLIRATLTIHTAFADGTKATSRQHVKITIPRAPKRAPKPARSPRFTG